MEIKGFAKGLSQRDFLVVFMIIVNAFSWYFPLHNFFINQISSFQMEHTLFLEAYGVYYIAVITFAVVGTIIVHKNISRETLLSLWMLFGVIASFLLAPLEVFQTQMIYVFLVAFALGVSLGLGFPSCLAYFSDYGSIEQKGRLGGITYCVASIGIFLMGLLTIILPSFQSMLAFALWRIIGFVVFIIAKPKKETTKIEAKVSYREIIQERSFVLYLVPWVMFCLVNFLEAAVLKSLFSADVDNLIPVMEFGVGSIAALVAGVFADLVGRKRIVIFGYVMIGMGYAALGLFPYEVLSWYFYIAVDGIAWGIFALVFFITIWGELAAYRTKDKYYFLGVLPFLASTYVEILFEPYAKTISVSTSFSLASLFLFLAVLPLMYAPETLPEKKIRERELKDYLKKAKETKEKYA
jgi:MFS family permease